MTTRLPEQKLLLKPREAAHSLNISERQLWAKTCPRGQIPAVRIGNCVRYERRALEQFIAEQQVIASADCE